MNQTVPKAESGSPDIESIHAIIETVRALTEIMHRETELLRAMRVRDFSSLQEKKLSLINSYEAKTRELRANPGFSKSLDPLLRGELTDVVQRMQDIMQENEQAILAARELNQRVATAIVDAVQSEKPQAELYGQNGGYQDQSRTPPISVQLDGRF